MAARVVKIKRKPMKSGKVSNYKKSLRRPRIAAGSKEKMRKPGTKGAPTKANFKAAKKTAKKK